MIESENAVQRVHCSITYIPMIRIELLSLLSEMSMEIGMN